MLVTVVPYMTPAAAWLQWSDGGRRHDTPASVDAVIRRYLTIVNQHPVASLVTVLFAFAVQYWTRKRLAALLRNFENEDAMYTSAVDASVTQYERSEATDAAWRNTGATVVGGVDVDCCVCLGGAIPFIVLGCGHFLCGACSAQVDSCPQCRRVIRTRIHVFQMTEALRRRGDQKTRCRSTDTPPLDGERAKHDSCSRSA